MGGYSSPLLDDYNRTGVVTPGFQRAMDIFKQKMGAQFQPPGGGTQPQPDQQSAAPALRPPDSQPPVPKFQMPGQQQGATPPLQAGAQPAPQHAQLTPEATAHQQELTRLTTGDTAKPGYEQIHNPWLRGLATAGNIAETMFAPRAALATPGTTLHHNALVSRQKGLVDLDEQLAGNAEKRHLEHAQATEQEALPAFHEAQTENTATKAENDRLKAQGETDRKASADQMRHADAQSRESVTLAQHGFKRDESGAIVPLPYEEMSQEQQGVHDLKAAQAEMADATKALREAQAKNVPQAAQLAQRRLDSAAQAHSIALRRLNLSESQFEMRSRGTQGGEALPGSMIGDDGRPVGTAFQQNVRPTSAERGKGDLANSAAEQIADIKEIVKKRPDIFGPVAGRKTDFTVWLGSQDPDAQRFQAARTIAADHLAGVFGGRSESALQHLDDAIGRFRDNPEAVSAGLDQVVKGNEVFQKAGTVHTAGSNAARGGAPARPKGVPENATWNSQKRQWEAP